MTKADMRDELDQLLKIVSDLTKRMKVLRYEMHNRSPIRRARAVSTPISPQMRHSIRSMAIQFPDMTMTQIAHAHGLNSEGRISEILRGIRR